MGVNPYQARMVCINWNLTLGEHHSSYSQGRYTDTRGVCKVQEDGKDTILRRIGRDQNERGLGVRKDQFMKQFTGGPCIVAIAWPGRTVVITCRAKCLTRVVNPFLSSKRNHERSTTKTHELFPTHTHQLLAKE